MDSVIAINNMKTFRRWMNGSGRKYIYAVPIPLSDVSESINALCDIAAIKVSPTDLCQVVCAAKMWHDVSSKMLSRSFKDGGIAKDSFVELSGHLNELKSSIAATEKIASKFRKVAKKNADNE